MSDHRWNGLTGFGAAGVTLSLAGFVAANLANGNIFWDPWTVLAGATGVGSAFLILVPDHLKDRDRKREETLERKRVLYAPRVTWLPVFLNEGCGILTAVAEGDDLAMMGTLGAKWWDKTLAHFGQWGISGSVPSALLPVQPPETSRDALLAFLHPRVDFVNRTLREIQQELGESS
jgi:hypothetical protein